MVSDSDAGGREQLNTCGRCGDKYEPYVVFIKDNFSDIAEYVETKDEYDGLCKPCRAAVAPNGYFSGAQEVKPKRELHTDS